MRIVYLSELPHQQRTAERLGFAAMEAHGFQLEFWDLSQALGVHLDELPDPRVRRFRSVSAAAQALRYDPPEYAINLLRCDYRRWPVYRALAARGVGYALLGNNPLPPVPAAPARAHLRRSLGDLLIALSMRIPLRWLGIRPAAHILVGGEASLKAFSRLYRRLVVPSTQVVWAHSADYERVVQAGEPPDRSGPAVFLDEFMPFHPDWQHLGLEPPIGAEEYYAGLRGLFDRLGVPVVIAAHPRSSYPEPSRWFGPREVVTGDTCALVRRAPFVIAHMSTAVSYAVIYKKPVLFVTMDRLAASHPTGPAIETMAAALGRRPVNLDHPPTTLDVDAFDEVAYERYLREYLKRPGSPEQPLWEILAQAL